MPQVDLETLVSACAGGGGGDNKIACETLATDKDYNNRRDNQQPDQSEIPADFPPESFCLSKDAEFDWFDRNVFYERKESQKGNSNSTNLNPNPSSTSQRFATTLKAKPSIFGLPKLQKLFVDTRSKRNCKPANTRWFPKRSASTLKSDATLAEPSSPKVSCMGRVRSNKDRRTLKNRQRSASESGTGTVKTKSGKGGKTGFLSKFRSIFGSGLKKGTKSETKADTLRVSPSRNGGKVMSHDIRERLPPGDIETPPRNSEARKSVDGEPVGLGGMKRFTSGRRSDAWLDDVV
ncbi:uncharacterized protein LOC123227157 [Mangifera indica]|uniref:uncharacterized protein LOC123227157 n=1 Tax=Mangifera indica TaxID=29780 RepID=UPI001CFB3B59|nr:uncharacterized protein LOC123227157 [Mangifera indica]